MSTFFETNCIPFAKIIDTHTRTAGVYNSEVHNISRACFSGIVEEKQEEK